MEECKACGGRIVYVGGDPTVKVERATAYASADHECSECGLRYSNSRDMAGRTAFTPRPAGNIPVEIAEGLGPVLANSINEVNRRKKTDWFCASTSEDAITWSVFRWLQQAGKASILPELCHTRTPAGQASLLLWGAPAGGPDAESLRDLIIEVSDSFGEDRRRRTEMDVLLVWPDLVMVVEVKYRSPNDRRAGRCGPRLAQYVTAEFFAAECAEVDREGYYELVRNWALGARLAQRLGRRFLLVNLAPAARRSDVERFLPQLKVAEDRRIAFVSWGELADAMERDDSTPEWLREYLTARQLLADGAYA
jgi:hypothetical protein